MNASPAPDGAAKFRANGAELLVSVRSLAEARQAIGSPIDILDFKEPRAGALAAVASPLWHQAAELVHPTAVGRVIPLSAALGERDTAVKLAGEVPSQFSFVKAGPSGCETVRDLVLLWSAVRASLADGVELVAVAYADAAAARSLEPEEVIRVAGREGFSRILIDTFVKDGRSSIDHLGLQRLRMIRHSTRQLGLGWMLAGSIRERDLEGWWNRDTGPDGFGIRGDVCESGRTSNLSPERIASWRRTLDQS